MILSRCFVKVYHQERKPLANNQFLRFFDRLEAIRLAADAEVIKDVRFAITGETTKDDSPIESPTQQTG